MRSSVKLAALTSTLLAIQPFLPAASSAQTLDAPATVQAAVDGSFSYQATFTAGPGGDNIYAYVVENLENTDVGIFFGDLFCVSPLAAGEQRLIELPQSPGLIAGSLVDPGLQGTIEVQVDTDCSCCSQTPGSGLQLTVTTTILPFPPPVPTLSRWALGGLCVALLVATSAALRRT